MGNLSGRRVLLTGASRGVGLEVVKLFAAEGAEIIGVARDAAKLKSLEGQARGFQGLAGDITDPSLAAQVADAVESRWGALDILLNNAAIQAWNKGFHDEPVGALEKNFAVNVVAPHRFIHALLPFLKKGREPRVINVSSGAGTYSSLSDPSMPAYRLSKYAL